MILPSAQAAEITEDKVKSYLLNPDHPDGASKARYFSSLGFTVEDWLGLAEALSRIALTSAVAKRIETG